MRRLTIFLSLILIACLLLTLANAGRWLVIDQPPRQAGVIIVLGGDPARIQLGIDLYRRGYAPYLLFTGAGPLTKAYLADRGIPAQAVITEEQADSTYENALYSRPLVEQHGFRSALVVSSDFHMLRVKLTFLRVFKNTGDAFTFCSISDPAFNGGNQWWASSQNVRHVLREYCGIASLYLGLAPYATDTLINKSPLLSFLFNS